MNSTMTQASFTETESPKQDIGFIGVDQQVQYYFEYLNAGEFQAAAELFHSTGVLYPPFGQAVVGQAAIANYLKREAEGMKLTPRQHQVELLETGDWQCEVRGTVQTVLFSVNVAWTFVLSNTTELISVKVKLLASLQELLNLKQTENL